ncbi:hypothetical protein C9374_004507 [Naegleria lovaniensis]|uniref:Rho-GAP domain-containing protein n=1 Tax=Naegleria lovaniensis TaxID=51637 RepID=A0AA88GMP4_NAELO|nr:uncharacterized protein C9374_004507 [Naegleria lovaniensis]KAG2383170.1 hypothetical protein C9374_004507 [Naegleria lovaniensis]
MTSTSNSSGKLLLHIELSPTDQANTLHSKIIEIGGKKAKQTTFSDVLLQLQDELQMIFPQNSCFVMTTTCITPEMIIGSDANSTSTMSHSSTGSNNSSGGGSSTERGHNRMTSFGTGLVNMMYGVSSKKRKSVPGSFYYQQNDFALLDRKNTNESSTSTQESDLGDVEMRREFIKMKSAVLSLKEYAHNFHILSSDAQAPVHDILYLELFPNCAPTKAKVYGNYLQTICKNETLFNFHFLMKHLKANALNSNWIVSELESGKKVQLTTLMSPLTIRSPLSMKTISSASIDWKNIETLYSSLTEEERFHVREPALFLLKEVKIPFVLRACFNFLRTSPSESDPPRLCCEGIFRMAGSKMKIEKFVKKFNTMLAFPHLFPNGVQFAPGTDAHMVADLVKRFLREMQDPLLTYEKYDDFIRLYEPYIELDEISLESDPSVYTYVFEGTKRLIHTLPQTNQSVLRELLSILKLASVGEYSTVTKMTPKTMAIVMGTNLMFVPQSSVAVVLDDFKRMSIRAHLQKQQQTLPIICQVCRFLIENVDSLFSGGSNLMNSNLNTAGHRKSMSISLGGLSTADDFSSFSVLSGRRSAQFTTSMIQQLQNVIKEEGNSASNNVQAASTTNHQEILKKQEAADNAIKVMEEQMKEIEEDYQNQLQLLSGELEELRKDLAFKDETIMSLKKETFTNLQKEDAIKKLNETLLFIQKEKTELETLSNNLKQQLEEKEEQNKELTEFCERLTLNLESKEKELEEKTKGQQTNHTSPRGATIDLRQRQQEEEERKLYMENRLAQLLAQEQVKWKNEVQELLASEKEKWMKTAEQEKTTLTSRNEKQRDELEKSHAKQLEQLKQEYETKLTSLKKEKENSENSLRVEFQQQVQEQTKKIQEELQEALSKQRAQIEQDELVPLQQQVASLNEELVIKTKQFYHQALLNMKLVLNDHNFDIPELVEQAMNEKVPETNMNEWISKKLSMIK